MSNKPTLKTILQHPRLAFLPLFNGKHLRWLPDRYYLRFEYLIITGHILHLNNPVTFNEKIQYLKVNDRREIYSYLADKLTARKFVTETIGDKYLVPLLGAWDDAGEIDFDALPDRFALKCTHGYGDMVLCQDKTTLDIPAARNTLNASLKEDFFYRGREWAYSNTHPKIMAEQFIDDGGRRPADYKFMCFNGTVKYICISRSLGDTDGCVSFYNSDGTRAPFKRVDYPECPGADVLPRHIDEMKALAETLAKRADVPFVRVDFYEAGGRIYFSEFTFYPCGGTMFFDPPEYDEKMGKELQL